MGSYKSLLNSLSNDASLHQLDDEQLKRLKSTLLNAFIDLQDCCIRNNLTLMLIGGSALGCVRHKGFIPWDDDLDVAMPRADYEKLKVIFDRELGEKYVLSSPNYYGEAYGRYPIMLIKGTRFVEIGMSPDDDRARIKIDIFVIDNIPDSSLVRYLKGIWSTFLMFVCSYVHSYQYDNESMRSFMCKTAAGKREYYKRKRIGRLFSFHSFQKWSNMVDHSFQYRKKTSLMGIPSGRGHYFGEIRSASTFVPVSEGVFEGLSVNLPGDPNDYLSNLYGADYMTIPPEEKRERHFFIDIRFKEEE